MSNKESSMRNWVIIIGVLVIFAVITAVWSNVISNAPAPSLGGGERQEAIPVEIENFDFEIKPVQITQPFPVIFGIEIPPVDFEAFPGWKRENVNPLVAIGILFVLAFGLPIVVGGLAIAGPIMTASNLVEKEKASTAYQENTTRLESAEKELLKKMSEGRTTIEPNHERPRAVSVTTVLTILMFAFFTALMLNGTFFPEGELTTSGGNFIRTTPLFIGITLLVALIGSWLWMNPKTIALPDSNDFSGIPWDTIAIVMTGLVVLGLGVGAMAWILAQGAAG